MEKGLEVATMNEWIFEDTKRHQYVAKFEKTLLDDEIKYATSKEVYNAIVYEGTRAEAEKAAAKMNEFNGYASDVIVARKPTEIEKAQVFSRNNWFKMRSIVLECMHGITDAEDFIRFMDDVLLAVPDNVVPTIDELYDYFDNWSDELYDRLEEESEEE